MSAFEEAVRSVKIAQDTKQNKIEWQPATLGDGHGNVDAGNNMVYVRLSANSSVIQVLNYRVTPTDGLRVRIAKTPEQPLHWQVIGQDDQRVDENGTSSGGGQYNVPPHHRTHEYLAADQVNIDWRQIQNLRVYAIAGTLTVGVLPGIIPRPGADIVVNSQVIDLTSHVPATGALYCLISIDSTGAIVATDGTLVDSPIDLVPADFPDTPTGNFRLAAVRLYATQTAISESTQSNDMRDLRWPQEYSALIPPGSAAAITTYYLDNASTGANIAYGCLDLDQARVVHAEGSTPGTGDGVHNTLFVQHWLTAMGYPGVINIPAGLWTVTLEAASTSPVEFYFEMSRVDTGGTPTVLLTSGSTGTVTTRQQITITASAPSTSLLITDRILIAVWAISGSPIPFGTIVTLYYDGAVDSHLTIPGQTTYRFIDLTDVPTSYTGQALKVPRVKSTEDGLEFTSTVPPSLHNILDSTYHSDVLTGSITRGDLLYGNATPKIARLALGGIAGSILTRDATDVAWSAGALSFSGAFTLTIPATGTTLLRDANIAAGRIAFGSDANTVSGDADLTWDSINKKLTDAGHMVFSPLTAPGAPTIGSVTAGGSVDTGDHYYKVTFVTAIGETEFGTESLVATTGGGNNTVNLTNIPTGPTGTTARKIYRTNPAVHISFYSLLATIGNNSDTTYTDTASDASIAINGEAQSRWNTTAGKIFVGSDLAGYIGYSNTFLGLRAPTPTTGFDSTLIGWGALAALTSGYNLTAVGVNALGAATTAINNTAIGVHSFQNLVNGNHSTAIGVNSGRLQIDGDFNAYYGYSAGYNNLHGSSNVFLGPYAGYYETGSNKLFIDNQTRASEADARIKSLLYGVFDSAMTNQQLTINAPVMNVKNDVAHTQFIIDSGPYSGGGFYISASAATTGLHPYCYMVLNGASTTAYAEIAAADDGGWRNVVIAPSGGNVGIGIQPAVRLHVYNSVAGIGSSGDGAVIIERDDTVSYAQQLIIRGKTSTAKQLWIGYDTTDDFGAIQAYQVGSGARNLILQNAGGKIGFATTLSGAGVTYQVFNVNGAQLFVGADSSQESPMLQIAPSYISNTHASYKARSVVSVWDAGGARAALQIDTDGTQALIGLGGVTSPTARLHLPASSTSAASLKFDPGTAPTSPNAGDVWDDSTQKSIIGFLAGIKQALVGCIYSSHADVTVSGTASETTLLGGSAIGTLTLPANFWTVGKTIRIRGGGLHTMPGGSPTMQIRLYLAAVKVGDSTALVDKNDTNTAQEFDYTITCITTGGTGTVKCTGYMLHHEGTVDVNMFPFENTGTSTVDTTASMAVNLTVQFSTATGTSITASNMTIEVLN